MLLLTDPLAGVPGPNDYSVAATNKFTGPNVPEDLNPLRAAVSSDTSEAGFYAPEYAGLDAYLAEYVIRQERLDQPGCVADWLTGRLPEGSPWWLRLSAALLAERAGAELPCPLGMRVRSVFLAACRRRGKISEELIQSLWDQCQRAHRRGLDPFYDPVFDPAGPFAPELEMLARDRAAYARDFRRAKRFTAFVRSQNRVFEGLWVDQPESVLFADWAWRDTGRSADHKGFQIVATSWRDLTLIAADPGPRADLSGLYGVLGRPGGWIMAEPQPRDVNCGDRLDNADSDRGWWNLRTCGTAKFNPDDFEGILRVNLEGALFHEGAEWDATHKLLRPKKCERPAVAGNVMFWRIPLADGLEARLQPAAFDTIGSALWSVVRDAHDERKGIPVNFRDHLQGDSGGGAVWSRNGMAAAFMPEAEAFVDRLQANLRELNTLRDLALQSNPGKAYFDLHDKFARTLSSPEGRLLRRLAKRVDLYRLHRVNYDREMKEQATKHAGASEEHSSQARVHAGTSAAIQQKLEYFELLIVSVYAFELTHLLLGKPLELWAESGNPWVRLWAVLAPLAAAGGVCLIFPAARQLLIGKKEALTPAEKELEKGGDALVKRAKWVFGLLLGVAVLLWLAVLAVHPSREPHPAPADEVKGLVEKQVVQIESLKTGVSDLGKRLESIEKSVQAAHAAPPALPAPAKARKPGRARK
jgi:hypothetical protein